jgi:hypothetical protein
MTSSDLEVPDWPLMSEDSDWFAFSADSTRHQVASDLAYNWLDWWLDEYLTYDDNDCPKGWVAGWRALLSGIRRGFIRPQSRLEDSDYYREMEDWWHECREDHPAAIPVWIWRDE